MLILLGDPFVFISFFAYTESFKKYANPTKWMHMESGNFIPPIKPGHFAKRMHVLPKFLTLTLLSLLFILVSGCTTLRSPQPSPSPLPEVSITPPAYASILAASSTCPNKNCATLIGQPVLVFAENRINITTKQKRAIPLDIPECTVVEVAFDQSSLSMEKLIVDSNDYSNYFNLYYFIPFRRGTYNVKIKTSCEVRGTFFTISAK
jgi:hypothetical protein